MKKLMIMIVSLFVVSSIAFANPTNQIDMSKTDSQFLFNGNATTTTLNNSEMMTTEGKRIPILSGIIDMTKCVINKKITFVKKVISIPGQVIGSVVAEEIHCTPKNKILSFLI